MIPADLEERMRKMPGRCPECLTAPALQGGHLPDCSEHTPPVTVLLEPDPSGLTCTNWLGDRGQVCGASEGVRPYIVGDRCPACTPAALRLNPIIVRRPAPQPVLPEPVAEPEPEPDLEPVVELQQPEPVDEVELEPEPVEPEPEPEVEVEKSEPVPELEPEPELEPAPEPVPLAIVEPDMGADEGLFEHERPPAVSLADKFAFPPMSVLDRRAGDWQARRRRWLSLGIQSELGRTDAALPVSVAARTDPFSQLVRSKSAELGGLSGASVFDPVVCELVYRWHTRTGDTVLDPFAGGSVRGIVANVLGRRYVGVELRPEQVAANRAQDHLATGPAAAPVWVAGDSAEVIPAAFDPGTVDLVFSCPPYADLEVYSDDPRDLSTMTYEAFTAAHRHIIATAAERLQPDRFAAWVVSDVRGPSGAYRGLVKDTIRAFQEAGLSLHNEAVLVDPVGTGALRAEKPFRNTRKLTRCHQYLLVFVKGDAKRAARRVEVTTDA